MQFNLGDPTCNCVQYISYLIDKYNTAASVDDDNDLMMMMMMMKFFCLILIMIIIIVSVAAMKYQCISCGQNYTFFKESIQHAIEKHPDLEIRHKELDGQDVKTVKYKVTAELCREQGRTITIDDINKTIHISKRNSKHGVGPNLSCSYATNRIWTQSKHKLYSSL